MLIALIFSGTSLMAQSAKFGIKGGLNYGATGDYQNVNEAASDFSSSFEEGENRTGFHLGLFSQFEMLGIFLQPELMYTQLKTKYNSFDYKLTKIDAPVLLGLKGAWTTKHQGRSLFSICTEKRAGEHQLFGE